MAESIASRALAQKLTIRLSRHYTSGKLVVINSHALLIKWFSESGKLVGKMFEDIQAIANEETSFICVLIDEVESIAGSREKSAQGSDCSDRLRDPAFLDRVDVKQHIPNPSPTAIYKIFRCCFNELIRTKLITSTPDSTAVTGSSRSSSSSTGDHSPSPDSPISSSCGAGSWSCFTPSVSPHAPRCMCTSAISIWRRRAGSGKSLGSATI
ncbi:hypothetical protein LTR28_011703 [Elasticomyces elasticus]|nr:hypothetical protein LTR28_011703 [Elasticomyces elasticus]